MTNPVIDFNTYMQIDTRLSVDPQALMHALTDTPNSIDGTTAEYEMFPDYPSDVEMRDPVEELIKKHEEAINIDMDIIQEETYLITSVAKLSKDEYLRRLENLVVRKYTVYSELMTKINSLRYLENTFN